MATNDQHDEQSRPKSDPKSRVIDSAAAPNAATARPTRVWTDGACKGNPGPGGWGWVTQDGRSDSGGEDHTTNQRMEIVAAAEAVRAIDGPLEVISDSTYVVSCFNKGWYKGWLSRGWTNSQKKPVANRDLWEPFIAAVLARGNITFTWVKGHAGDRMNEKADVLAQSAADEVALALRTARAGDGTANDGESRRSTSSGADMNGGLSATGSPASGEAVTDSRVPPGWRLVILGQRLLADDQRDVAHHQLRQILAGFLEMHPDLVVLSGLREGAESVGAAAATGLGVPLVAVLPWPNPAAGWPPATRQRFDADVQAASSVVTLEKKVPSSVEEKRASIRRRTGWLAKNATAAVVIHDGRDPEGIAALRHVSRLGDDVWDLDLSVYAGVDR